MREVKVQLPAHGWTPRDYQKPAWDAFIYDGVLRLCEAWHRRAGKDEFILHGTAIKTQQRVGTYWHMLPAANQVRKAIWEAVNPLTGRKRIDDAFPLELRRTTRNTDMFIEFQNGSTWQALGSDNFSTSIGSPPVGVAFSEYALANPSAWGYLRPILIENGGWAAFISTPRGRNHFYRMYEFAKNDPSWHSQHLTVAQTKVVSLAVIENERRELRAERGYAEADALIAQEWFCDWAAAIPGSYYGAHMSRLEQRQMIGDFPVLPGLPVFTAWDIGKGDQTVVWCWQQEPNGRIRIVDVLVGSGVGVDWYARNLVARGWVMPFNAWPPDGAIHEWGAEHSRPEMATKLGVKPFVLSSAQRGSIEMGIQMVRVLLQQVAFNRKPEPWLHEIEGSSSLAEAQDSANDRMGRALDAMSEYHREWDDVRKTFRENPFHNWSSDFADSFRYLAISRQYMPTDLMPGSGLRGERQSVALSDYDIFG